MATPTYKIIKCPHCHEDFEAKFWSVVRGDIDIDLKEMIINGEFNLLMCPNCNKIFSYEENFVYMDPQAQILAVVLPQYYQFRDDLTSKLKEDYEAIAKYLTTEKNIDVKPYYFYGIEELINLLTRDREIEEETDVIEFIAKEKGLKTKKIDKNYAREYDLPFLIIYSESLKKYDVIDILNEIYSKYKKLKRIKNLIEHLESIDEEEINFLKDDN